VDWCWLGSNRFTAPFFDNTIDQAQLSPFNSLFTHRTPIAELGAWCAASPGLAPAGFIFHMSRCGSTLVTQMLASLPQNLVISEASPLDRLARASSIPAEARAAWLPWMISALGQRRSGQETRYFIKFDSPTTLALPLIRRVFPSVPWIFLYRDPEEVLVSQLREPAAAMLPGIITDIRIIDAPMAEILSMTVMESAARAIGRICECARLAVDEPGMLVNYAALPGAVSGAIAEHFGLTLSQDDLDQMHLASLHNAKRPRQRFEADGQSKRLEASQAVREAARRWITPHYDELERIRQKRRSPVPESPAMSTERN